MAKDKTSRPLPPKGTRDFLPAQMRQREKVISLVKSVFEKFGYEPLETPALENLEVLSGKYGEEGEKLIFKILRRGEELKGVVEKLAGSDKEKGAESALSDLGLRYDLTVPLARVVAGYQQDIKFPFKRYQIQPVWRADRPQKGRYREFYQCDADVVGSSSLLADAEIIRMSYEILNALNFKEFKIRLNHRRILTGLVEYCGAGKEKEVSILTALDKFDKVGKKGVAEELEKRGISKTAREKLTGLLEIEGGSEKVLDELGMALPDSEGVRQIRELLAHLSDLQVPSERISVELYLARGLDYYTGPIFESVVEQPQIGSLTGGGRYDKLIGMFLGRDIPATGTSIGLERIIDVMQEYKLLEETGGAGGVLVTVFNPETRSDSLRIGTELRDRGVKTQIFLGDKDSLRDQIGYASYRQIRFVVIIGPAEAKSGQAQVKDLKTGGQETYPQSELAEKSAKIFSD